jgi:putative transposase
VLGVKVATSETKEAWNTFFADLVARALAGVKLVTSDAHAGLVEAIAANLPGAAWQRCRTHYADLRFMPMSSLMPLRGCGSVLARSA